jgi:acyl dehydratase
VSAQEVSALSLPKLYGSAALGAVRRRPADAELPDVELVRRDVAIDVDHLAAYGRVCGYRLTGALPLTYPHVLAFPLALALLTRRDFPLGALGLVHVANRFEAIAPLSVVDRPTLRVRAAGLRPHPRGQQVDVVAEAHVDGACAWRSRATYLRRAGGRGGGTDPGAATDHPAPPAATAEAAVGVLWSVPADIGKRYARVSGDRNPIHTSRLAARLFGFRGRIAHGMWSAARCLAALEGRLPDAVTAEVSFKRPVLLPARVLFAATPAAGAALWGLSLTAATDGRTHLAGTVTSRP